MNERDTVEVGIVGLGTIGQYHADQLSALDAELVAGVDVDADARRAFAEEYGASTFEDAAALYDAVDAVIVTTPNRFHEEYAVEALEAGLDVLVEKPLAHSVESAERIAAAARAAPGFCMVGFNNRFRRPVRVLRHYLDAGRFGDLTHVEAAYVRRRGIPARGSWFTSEAIAGGGALVDIGVHAVDLALYFLGFPDVTEVSGVTRSNFGARDDYAFVDTWGEDGGPEGFDVEDSASAFLRCANGATVSLEVAWAANRPDSDTYYLRGTDGGARLDRGNEELTLYDASTGGDNHLLDADVETRRTNPHQDEQRAFLSAVRAGEAPGTNTVDEGVAVQRVLDAIYRSAAAGEAIRLD